MKLLPLPKLPALACILALLLHPVLTWATDGTDGNFSAANTALFMTDHLKNLQPGEKLVYGLEQSGAEDEWFKDTVTLELKATGDGHKEALVEYLTGERNRWVPSFTDPSGNPVLMLFLQGDINQMERLNGGNWRHFQKYIKLALEDGAALEDVEFDYAGSTRHGKKVSIRPFVNDPEGSKFKEQAFINKQYDFILSDEVPGGLYKISTLVPPTAATGGKPYSSTELLLH